MLLRNSISNTKKFFQKTIDNFKSFLTKGSTYERLPKSTRFSPFACGRDDNDDLVIESGCKDLDNFYVEFTHQWDDSHKSKVKNNRFQKLKKSQEFCTNPPQKDHYVTSARFEVKRNISTATINQTHDIYPNKQGDSAENMILVSKPNYTEQKGVNSKNSDNLLMKKALKLSDFCSRSVRERRLSSVAHKLKEFEQIDKGNVEHKLDVDEVLHYYARLTCPAYLDIVDNFFTEMCAEFLGPSLHEVKL